MTERTVLIVGACGGTGIEVAKLLLQEGYLVIGTVLDDGEAVRLRAALPAIADVLVVDLSDADLAEAALRDLLEPIVSPLAGVIVCAATSNYGPLEVLNIAAARKVMEVNLFSHLAIYRACLPRLRTDAGRLVFMGSFGGKIALPFLGHYTASKFALEGLCDVMRREAHYFDVPVVLVQPGSIRTAMATDQLGSIDANSAALNPVQAALYRERYAEWKNVAVKSCENCNEPKDIAVVVVHAFKVENPEARYVAGADAEELLSLNRRVGDREMDGFLRQMYSDVGSITAMGRAATERSA